MFLLGCWWLREWNSLFLLFLSSSTGRHCKWLFDNNLLAISNDIYKGWNRRIHTSYVQYLRLRVDLTNLIFLSIISSLSSKFSSLSCFCLSDLSICTRGLFCLASVCYSLLWVAVMAPWKCFLGKCLNNPMVDEPWKCLILHIQWHAVRGGHHGKNKIYNKQIY